MAVKKRTKEILAILDEQYSTELKCYLTHDSAWQLLIATIMSAQCTDARVNIVTKNLFAKYKSIEGFANADLDELMQDIKPVGFYKNKAKNIIGCCKKLHYEFNDEVPSDIDELTSLPGVGRKTANVIRGNVYGIDSIVVDTHVKRISNRLKLTDKDDPVAIEYELMKELPKDHWILYNIQIITFGRDICKAVNPECERCRLREYCKENPR